MRLELKRIALKDKYTIGRLYANGRYVCDTIEDKVRDLNKNGEFDGAEKKVPGETAIPYGSYYVSMSTVSPKFSQKSFYKTNCHGGRVPRLTGVKHFDGILIHCGTDQNSSAGCIIVGYNREVGKVTDSKEAFLKLYGMLWDAYSIGEKIVIKIT